MILFAHPLPELQRHFGNCQRLDLFIHIYKPIHRLVLREVSLEGAYFTYFHKKKTTAQHSTTQIAENKIKM